MEVKESVSAILQVRNDKLKNNDDASTHIRSNVKLA